MEPTDDDLRGTLRELERVLANLTAPPERQRAYLEQLGTAPSLDELALEFDDRYVLASRLRERGLLDDSQKSLLDAVNAQLKLMSGRVNAELWTLAALGRAEWARVRELAESALRALEDAAS